MPRSLHPVSFKCFLEFIMTNYNYVGTSDPSSIGIAAIIVGPTEICPWVSPFMTNCLSFLRLRVLKPLCGLLHSCHTLLLHISVVLTAYFLLSSRTCLLRFSWGHRCSQKCPFNWSWGSLGLLLLILLLEMIRLLLVSYASGHKVLVNFMSFLFLWSHLVVLSDVSIYLLGLEIPWSLPA